MSRQRIFRCAARYGGCDHRWTVSVADVVLNDQNRAKPALLAAHNGAEIRIINVSAPNVHEKNILSLTTYDIFVSLSLIILVSSTLF